jgi:hypothetical protein
MVNYTCNICGKIFKQKSNYMNHTKNKKIPCKTPSKISSKIPCKISNQIISDNENLISQNSLKIIPNLSIKPIKKICAIKKIIPNMDEHRIMEDEYINNKKYKCKYCEGEFSRIDNFNRHINIYCKSKKKYDEFDILKAKYENVLSKYEELIELFNNNVSNSNNKNNCINSNNSNNVCQTNSNNITIVQFGKEDYSKIPNGLILNSLMTSTGIGIPCKLIEKMHFNNDYPEFQNVCITDKNRKYALLWNGDNWQCKKYENIGFDMLDRCLCLITDRMEQIEKGIDDKKALNIKKKL